MQIGFSNLEFYKAPKNISEDIRKITGTDSVLSIGNFFNIQNPIATVLKRHLHLLNQSAVQKFQDSYPFLKKLETDKELVCIFEIDRSLSIRGSNLGFIDKSQLIQILQLNNSNLTFNDLNFGIQASDCLGIYRCHLYRVSKPLELIKNNSNIVHYSPMRSTTPRYQDLLKKFGSYVGFVSLQVNSKHDCCGLYNINNFSLVTPTYIDNAFEVEFLNYFIDMIYIAEYYNINFFNTKHHQNLEQVYYTHAWMSNKQLLGQTTNGQSFFKSIILGKKAKTNLMNFHLVEESGIKSRSTSSILYPFFAFPNKRITDLLTQNINSNYIMNPLEIQ